MSPMPPTTKSRPTSVVMVDLEGLNDVDAHQPDETSQSNDSDPIVHMRTIGWKMTTLLMMIGLGVFGVSTAFQDVGIVLGVLFLTLTAALMTWSNYQIGRFKRNHPDCYGLEGAAYILLGPFGRIIFFIVFIFYWIFVTGSALTAVSTGLEVLAGPQDCHVPWLIISYVIGLALCSSKDLRSIACAAMPGMVLIIVSVFVLMIAVSQQDRPAMAPREGSWASDWKWIGAPTFTQAMKSISTFIFAFSGTPAFFQIEAEMKQPKDYNKAMLTCQGVVYCIYLVVGLVVYYYCGTFVTSPALGSTTVIFQRICYGIAMFGLFVTTMIVAHIPSKAIFMAVVGWKPQWHHHASMRNWKAWVLWLFCTSTITSVALAIAKCTPSFDQLVSLIGSFFGNFICIVPYGVMWLYDDLGKNRWQGKALRWNERSMVRKALTVVAVMITLAGLFLMVGGTYSSIQEMIETHKNLSQAGGRCGEV